MLPRLVLNSWAQVILPPQPSKMESKRTSGYHVVILHPKETGEVGNFVATLSLWVLELRSPCGKMVFVTKSYSCCIIALVYMVRNRGGSEKNIHVFCIPQNCRKENPEYGFLEGLGKSCELCCFCFVFMEEDVSVYFIIMNVFLTRFLVLPRAVARLVMVLKGHCSVASEKCQLLEPEFSEVFLCPPAPRCVEDCSPRSRVLPKHLTNALDPLLRKKNLQNVHNQNHTVFQFCGVWVFACRGLTSLCYAPPRLADVLRDFEDTCLIVFLIGSLLGNI
ncbi:LOW QUALITY PROTEIN: hypothetical protein AAY473_035502 [Plecturocebus cupreus]